MSLAEYLFIDEKRINSYFEQISSPTAYDMIPTWKAGLSITTLGVEATQSRFARPYTVTEKITHIIKYLQEKNLLLDDKFLGRNKGEFYNTSLRAVKFYIPPKPELTNFSSGITLWLGYPFRNFFLCLLEDFQGDDKPANFMQAFSVYSRLFMLVTTLRGVEKEISQTVTGVALDKLKLMRDGKLVYWDVISWGQTNCDHDPELFLSKIGAQFVAERSIRCLHRVRDVALGQGAFAYPLFITATDET